jgi:anaerobic selenocysteine-containing dehydrogenase
LNGLAATMNSIGLGLDSLEELQEELGTLLAPADHRMEATTMVASIVASAPPPGAILFTYPLLVDEGRMSRSADELKLAQEQPAFVEINTEDAAGAGIENGAQVRLKTEAGEAVLPARVTDHIAKGAVFVPWNQPGFQANTLLSGSFTTPVTLESADAEVAEQPAEVEA